MLSTLLFSVITQSQQNCQEQHRYFPSKTKKQRGMKPLYGARGMLSVILDRGLNVTKEK